MASYFTTTRSAFFSAKCVCKNTRRSKTRAYRARIILCTYEFASVGLVQSFVMRPAAVIVHDAPRKAVAVLQ